jgi:pilus assembly protein CpaB
MAIEKQKLILIGGLVLGVVAVFMVKMTIDQQKLVAREQAKKAIANMQANQSSVLIAKEDIPKGTLIALNMLDTEIVPNKFVQPQAATSLDRIAGMITLVSISKGEQITLSKLTNTKNTAGGGGNLAGITPIGKRAISISVDNISSLSGMIKPGDYVDVIAILQIPVQEGTQRTNQIAVLPMFQNVLVLAVGQNTGGLVSDGGRYAKDESRASGPPLVTLALAPQEAGYIAFVQEQGKIRLTLRSPADAKLESTTPANWASLFQYLTPPSPPVDQEAEKAAYDRVPRVEIYRGLNKEVVPLSK